MIMMMMILVLKNMKAHYLVTKPYPQPSGLSPFFCKLLSPLVFQAAFPRSMIMEFMYTFCYAHVQRV
jgi:hypothetical protein